MNRLFDRYCRLLDGLMAAFLAVMVVLVFGNVVLRYVFNSGITVSEELSRWLFVWVTFLGAIVALRDKGHLGTDVVVALLPRAGKKACLLLGHGLMLVICGLVFDGSWKQLRINWDVQAPVTGLSMGWFYAPGVVFAVSGAALLVLDVLKALRGQLTDADMVQVTASEDLAHGHGTAPDDASAATPSSHAR
ncbi:MAG: TRAP transporter small permease [Caldimonas manganoxidans]|nr:TRAP transporter small permease [Caldimonas manganoxidans]